MSILSAIKETQHDSKNLEELAKLPQTLIMSMVQRGEIEETMLMPILGKKAEMADDAARMRAAEQLAAQGGVQPTVMDQYMGKIAQAENPAPPMPEQQMQQPMPQQMAQAPMPEDVGIASQATQPMQMAGGGIIAFDDGGDVDVEPDDDYQDMVDQANEDSTNEDIYALIEQMGENNVGIRSGANKQISQDTRERATGDLESRLRAAIMQKESGGKRYDKNGNLLTSSKGAQGEMQVMPFTAKDPGFGIKPAQSSHPDELRRVGDEYASMLLNRYRDPKLAMIAYNMGPGATDKWLAAGADIRKLPKETQGYISNVRLAQGGLASIPKFSGATGPSLVGEYNFGYDSPVDTPVEEELKKSKKEGRPLSKEAQKYLDSKSAKPSASRVASPTANSLTKVGMGNRILGAGAVPAGIVAGGTQLGVSSMDTMANNPYFEGYSDPFMGDLAVGNAILNVNKDKIREADYKKEKAAKPKVNNQAPAPAPVLTAPVETKPSSQADTPQAKAEEEAFNLMQYFRDQQARQDKLAEKDKWQAGLAAGLGMLGGTSQYWSENVGKGGQMGVQSLANSQKLRATQDIANNKMLGTAYNAEMLNKLRKEQLAQGKESKSDKLAQDLIIAKGAHIDRVAKERGMDLSMMHNLEREKAVAAAEGKSFDTKKQANLDYYKNMYKKIQDEANRMYPSPRSSSGVIKLD